MVQSHAPASDRRSVAIVGVGCRFPGGVVDVASFWRLVSEGTDAITEIPPDRIDVKHFYDPRPATPGRMASPYGGFLDRIDEFDATFFGISPREAQSMDPQQRVLLETAWEAFEDAGENVVALEGSRTSVFIGQWVSDFEARLFANPDRVDFAMTTGSGRYATSGRISYVFGLRGPSFTIDCACSSSLVAVHLGVQSIRTGEADLALAGGVNMILQPHINIGYSQSRMIAPDGRCKFGDASGDGYVRSEGAGLVVLKALDRALADGDRIYAVIRGTSVNNDGRSSGVLGRPSRIGHEELLRAAYTDAGLPPARVGYIEAHGTGTHAGDPVELAALGAVVGHGRPAGDPCLIGSVKTNFGHTEGAAGIAGLIKASLALYHGFVPASLHFVEPNPNVPWAELPFRVPAALTAWPSGDQPRVAGVNSFGISGTNAHAVLEEAPPRAIPMVSAPTGGGLLAHAVLEEVASPPANREVSASGALVLPLSAKSPDALRALAGRYRERLDDQQVSAQDVCWGAATRRTALDLRAVLVAADRGSLAESLRAYANGEGLAIEGDVSQTRRPRIAFVCPGQGAQWVGMARDLAARAPVFRDALEECDRAARPYVNWSILAQLHAQLGTPEYLLDQIDVIQPVLVSLSIAYARLLRSLGVEPAAVVGHSMGEVAAAQIAGVLSLDQAMRIICRRSALMRTTSGRGAMALVELSMDETRARIAGHDAHLSVAVSNSPRSSVISGAPDAIQQVVAGLERDGVFCRLVKVDVASHSPQMQPLADTLAGELAGMTTGEAAIPIFSTVLARRAEGTEFGASYWSSNLRQPVLFTGAVSQMLDDGITAFVELGPHPVLLPSVQQTAQALDRSVATVPCGSRDEPEWINMLAAVGALWVHGCNVNWNLVTGGGRIVDLPPYPWQRERHWVDVAEMAAGGAASGRTLARPDDESLGWLYRLAWTALEPRSGDRSAAALESCVVVGGDTADADALVTAARTAGARAVAVSQSDLDVALVREAPNTLVFVAGANEKAFAPVRLVQRVLAANPVRLPRLWFLTRGAHGVDARDQRISVEHAALWGAARVVAEEHPELWGGLIDLDDRTPLVSMAARIVEHIASGVEDQAALRGETWFALRIAAMSRPETSGIHAIQWRGDATYLITGGLGGVALHVARAMAAHGARRLVLLSRTSLPPRQQWADLDKNDPAADRVAAVLDLEARGIAVHTAAVDVSDESQLTAFLDRYKKEAWPPIRGVVHAAGSFQNRLIRDMDPASFDEVMRAKVEGARLLDRLLPDLDLFVLFSSTGAFLAQPGQANYAAANAGLDGLAYDRRARGRHALSIGWGVWEDTGLVRGRAGKQNVGEMARQGIRAFAPDQGATLFSWLTGSPSPAVTVLPIDWSAFARARAGRGLSLFRDVLGTAPGTTSTSDIAQALGQSATHTRRQLLEGLVREAVGRVLKIAPARLDARKALGELGLNSLMAMELRNRLEAAMGRSLSATLAWNHPTIDALVQYLAGGTREAPPAAASAQPEPTGSLADVSELSDEEAALALRSCK